MFSSQRMFTTVLLWFSVLPFLLGVGVAYQLILLPGYADFIRGYAAVTLIFLATLRGKDLFKQPAPRRFLLLCGVYIVLAANALLLTDFNHSLSVLLGCFLALLALELRLRDLGWVERCYFRLRLWTTFFISFSLVLIITAEI